VSQPQRTIGVCNGVGDFPAMTAIVRGIVRAAIRVYAARTAGINFEDLR
jgi:hypothetical protein